ncbi:MAG: LysR family transcriptional regulator, partial [Erysipelotrichaceae bacterium]|nr:LysR family transcriptional regulator [Erysipelotrichaceae bacterium]
MELQHLLEFAALVKHKSFTKAAKEMFVSQPALSKHIATLEKELGFSLLKRNSRNILITEEG